MFYPFKNPYPLAYVILLLGTHILYIRTVNIGKKYKTINNYVN